MKKRHQQKLIILSLVLFLLWNVPLVLVFDHSGEIFGFPMIYFFIFLIWILAIIISYIILHRHYE
ncbi:hypothetical protein M0D21_17750 [Aquimarina sp. D1M17]|uniref:hypothetical protein n=1 Tax=Aquimarina acroporae TaxID=2937283 RepID=UPI0020C062DE|nr:hypothetical protein [Aquimarina acroporae]MCK8523431.1 hypothetical protein [Aquimarina acroporae]